jgi:hypothetical protein
MPNFWEPEICAFSPLAKKKTKGGHGLHYFVLVKEVRIQDNAKAGKRKVL